MLISGTAVQLTLIRATCGPFQMTPESFVMSWLLNLAKNCLNVINEFSILVITRQKPYIYHYIDRQQASSLHTVFDILFKCTKLTLIIITIFNAFYYVRQLC